MMGGKIIKEGKTIAAAPNWETEKGMPIIGWFIGSDGRTYPVTINGVIFERPIRVIDPFRSCYIMGEEEKS
jgi:hypothetical protein